MQLYIGQIINFLIRVHTLPLDLLPCECVFLLVLVDIYIDALADSVIFIFKAADRLLIFVAERVGKLTFSGKNVLILYCATSILLSKKRLEPALQHLCCCSLILILLLGDIYNYCP